MMRKPQNKPGFVAIVMIVFLGLLAISACNQKTKKKQTVNVMA